MLGMPKNDFLTAPRGKLVAIVASLCVGIGLILIGVLSANHSGPAASRTADEPAVRAQLGHVSEPDAFREAYQVHLEHMVREQLQTFRAELDSRDKALEARGSAQMERFARLFNDWQARSDTVDRSRGATAAAPPVEPPKYVALHRYTDAGSPASVAMPAVSTPVSFHTGTVIEPAHTQTDAADLFVLPQDGWAEGRLINGVVTTQGGDFRYTQIKLHGPYHSANDRQHDVDGCVVLGEGSADIAAGRINIKPIKLTCTLPNNRTKTWQTAGYVVDSRDGIQGLAATLVNGGQGKLAAATAAGIIQGGGAFYAQRSLTSTFSPVTGSAASILTGNPANAVVGGAVDSAGRSLGQEVQAYYSAFRPTVQTGGGVEVVVFLTSPMPLPAGGEAISDVRASK